MPTGKGGFHALDLVPGAAEESRGLVSMHRAQRAVVCMVIIDIVIRSFTQAA